MTSDKNERLLRLGSRLKEYRQRTGLSISEAGKMLGVSDRDMRAWENGRSQPDADMFLQLCALYEVGHLSAFSDEITYEKDALSFDELQLLSVWRESSDSARQKALKVLIGYDLLRLRKQEDNIIWVDFYSN